MNYALPGFAALIEVYDIDPMEIVDNTPVKKQGVEDVYKRQGQEHYDIAQRVKQILQRNKELQDIISILGMEELSEEDKMVCLLYTSHGT